MCIERMVNTDTNHDISREISRRHQGQRSQAKAKTLLQFGAGLSQSRHALRHQRSQSHGMSCLYLSGKGKHQESRMTGRTQWPNSSLDMARQSPHEGCGAACDAAETSLGMRSGDVCGQLGWRHPHGSMQVPLMARFGEEAKNSRSLGGLRNQSTVTRCRWIGVGGTTARRRWSTEGKHRISFLVSDKAHA